MSIDVLEVVEAQGLLADLSGVDEYCHKNVIAPRIRKPNDGRRLIEETRLAGTNTIARALAAPFLVLIFSLYY